MVAVRPGRPRALGAAAEPYLAYLHLLHRSLHREFASTFLAHGSNTAPRDDVDLVTKLELVLEPDGSVKQVGVVRTSGTTDYDLGVINAVRRGAPYPAPPNAIHSADGLTYLRWSFHRGQSQCGAWNAEPYLLGEPSASAEARPN